MVLREAAGPDIGALCDAWFAMLQETGMLLDPIEAGWREPLREHFSTALAQGRHHWRIVEGDAGIAATGALFLLSDPAIAALSGLTGTIAGVYTYPAYRRRGFAQMLLTDLIAAARKLHCHTVRLRASEMGRPLYEKLGFRQADEMFFQLT